jgi:hypothetical protein
MTATAGAALSGIPDGLRKPLLDEFNKLARHYRESRWEPAELNGGKLCEIVYSILKGHVDGQFPASPSKPKNMVTACTALEQATSFPRSVRIQIPRMLMALYEIRNNRNVGHVGADVDPNHMDATVVYAMVKWIMAELVRLFHSVTPDEATAVVEALTEREIPLLWQVGGVTRVLGTNLGAKEKMLVLLYSAACAVPVNEIVKSIEYGNASRFRNSVLRAAHKADLIHFDAKADTATLSPVGIRFVEQTIPLALPA